MSRFANWFSDRIGVLPPEDTADWAVFWMAVLIAVILPLEIIALTVAAARVGLWVPLIVAWLVGIVGVKLILGR